MTRNLLATVALLVTISVASACEQCASAGGGAPTESAPKAGSKKTPAAKLTEKEKHKATAEAVWAKILAQANMVPGTNWPKELSTEPVFKVVEVVPTRSGPTEYNAVASLLKDEDGKVVKKDGKFVPLVRITYGMLKVVEGDEDAIACILGHELGHHALGHTVREPALKPVPLGAMDGHRREADADLYGAKLALKAGYSVRNGLKVQWRGWDRMGGIAVAAEVTCQSHPGDSDRAARILKALDDPEAALWQTMAAFENGVAFLAVEDFEAAEAAFEKVTTEFPKCYEAWANLGTAQLMRYCQGLSAEKIRRLQLGQFVGPAHFLTASSRLRDAGQEMWEAAVKNLERANELKEGSPVILVNLGLAYIVHPFGKEKGIANAKRYFEAAAKAMANANVFPRMEVTLLVNIGVGQLAVGETEKGRKSLAEAKTLANRVYYNRKRKEVVLPEPLAGALQFNMAAVKEQDNKEAAVELYEEYLRHTPRTSPWWPVAYERYEALCKDTGSHAKPKKDLGKAAPRRKQLVVTLPSGKTVHVGEQISLVLDRLGKPTKETKHPSSSVRVLRFEEHGVELIADQDEVFAVMIISPNGPTVPVQEAGVTGKKLGTLKVGLTRDEVEELLGTPSSAMLTSLNRKYDYYADLGVAVVYDKNGTVTSLIVGQLSKDEDWD